MSQSGFRSWPVKTPQTKPGQAKGQHGTHIVVLLRDFPKLSVRSYALQLLLDADKDATSRDCELKSEDSALAGLEIELHDSRVRNTAETLGSNLCLRINRLYPPA
jgi:hypothetical protein